MPSPGDENISNSEFRPQHLNCVVKLGLLHRLCVLNWELVRHFLISPLTFSLEYIRLWSWHQHPPMARVVPGSSHGMKNEWFSMNIFWYGWMTPWARNMQKWREFCRWNVFWGWFRSVTLNAARPSPPANGDSANVRIYWSHQTSQNGEYQQLWSWLPPLVNYGEVPRIGGWSWPTSHMTSSRRAEEYPISNRAMFYNIKLQAIASQRHDSVLCYYFLRLIN